MDLNKITPLSRTPPTKEKEQLETTKVLDDYYSEKFLKDYFKLSKNKISPINVEISKISKINER
jgi:hypothetical protein